MHAGVVSNPIIPKWGSRTGHPSTLHRPEYPHKSTRLSLSMEMSRLTQDGTADSVSRDQILRREHGQGNIIFPCSADHEQDWQPYPVDPNSCCMCGHTHIAGAKDHPAYNTSIIVCIRVYFLYIAQHPKYVFQQQIFLRSEALKMSPGSTYNIRPWLTLE